MVGVSIDVSLDELDDVAKDFAILAGLFGDLRPLLSALGEYGVTTTREHFRAEVGPDGEPWKPSGRARYEGGKTLTDSGRLSRSITAQVLGNDAVEWGTNVVYGPIHQFGGTIRARNAPALKFRLPGSGWVTAEEVFMPARPFLGLDQGAEDAVGDIVTEFVSQAFTGL